MKIEEAKKRRCACIYKLTFPDGKGYVGQTRDLRSRIGLYERFGTEDGNKVSEAIREHGLGDVEVSVLAEVSGLSPEDLSLALAVLEIKYIRQEGTIWPDGYNVSIGGEILGIPAEVINTRWGLGFGGPNRSVLVYDAEGKFVSEYDSIQKCAYSLGVDEDDIRGHLDKRNNLLKESYMLRSKKYGVIPESIIPYRPKKVEKVVYETRVVTKEREKVVVKRGRPVLKYDKEGHYCGMYETAVDAALSIGVQNIKKGILQHGYMFMDYDGGEIRQEIGPIGRGDVRLPRYSAVLEASENGMLAVERRSNGWGHLINDFRVGQYGRDGSRIDTFGSIKEASYMTGIPYSSIWACVFGRAKTARGYIWRKIADDSHEAEEENKTDSLF